MTSSHTRRAVAAATRAITLASRTKMPPFADTSYEVHPDASFPSYTSSHATRGFLADRHSKVPQNTPASRPSTHLRFNHTDENLHPASASASPSTPADDSFVHLSRSFLGLNERDLNSLPQPAFNANPPWQRLKSILQTITIADSPQDYVFENSMPNSPSPAAGASRSITPLTPPISPATTNTKLSPMSPSSPLAKFFFRPNPRSTSTPRSRSPRYNFTLPEFSTFDWMDAPSHRTWSTSVSLSDTEQSEGVARVCPALEALWMYESEEDDDFEVEEAPGDGSTGAGEAVPQEANAPDGNPLAKVDDMPDCSGSSRGLGLVVDFPLPPDRDVPKIGRTSGVGLPRPGAGVAEDSGVHAVHEPGRPSRHVATISDPSNARERQLLPSKFRPDLTPLAADGGGSSHSAVRVGSDVTDEQMLSRPRSLTSCAFQLHEGRSSLFAVLAILCSASCTLYGSRIPCSELIRGIMYLSRRRSVIFTSCHAYVGQSQASVWSSYLVESLHPCRHRLCQLLRRLLLLEIMTPINDLGREIPPILLRHFLPSFDQRSRRTELDLLVFCGVYRQGWDGQLTERVREGVRVFTVRLGGDVTGEVVVVATVSQPVASIDRPIRQARRQEAVMVQGSARRAENKDLLARQQTPSPIRAHPHPQDLTALLTHHLPAFPIFHHPLCLLECLDPPCVIVLDEELVIRRGGLHDPAVDGRFGRDGRGSEVVHDVLGAGGVTHDDDVGVAWSQRCGASRAKVRE